MIKQILFLDNKRVDAKAKLVLLAFAVRYQRGETPLIKVEDLAAELKHPAHMVAKAMQDLVGCNLIGEKYSVEGLGRPTRRFRLLLGEDEAMTASVYRDGMEPAAALNLIKKGRVRRPTRNKKEELEVAALEETPEERGIRRRREGRVSYLDASDILLLVALLVLASDRGVVQGVGLTQLASICGVSSVALQGRLKKLVQAGVVRQLVPGIASPLFSKKLKTVVILNLTHEMLGWSQPNQGQVIIHKYNHRMEGEFALVSGLCIDVRIPASVTGHSGHRDRFA
ncbi:hypothetical protein, partial [Pseudomonas sp. FME51]|uniref:hypothetical protein n=1 Tax=Pseudomonas sp. FME51 TaxID=2742609 RepID=UPI001866D4B2